MSCIFCDFDCLCIIDEETSKLYCDNFGYCLAQNDEDAKRNCKYFRKDEKNENDE
jgi:hypothetical protein